MSVLGNSAPNQNEQYEWVLQVGSVSSKIVYYFMRPLAHIFKILSKKTSKRHQLSMTFPCVFRFLTKKMSTFDDFSLCSQVSDKKHKEKSTKVDVFSVSFGLNFEDEGATGNKSLWVKSLWVKSLGIKSHLGNKSPF